MARVQQAAANITAIGSITPWLFHDFYEVPFDLTLMVSLGTGLAGTLSLDYIADDYLTDGERPVTISQSTTTITVVDGGPNIPALAGAGHGLAVGDAVSLRATPGGSVDGIYAVASVTSATVYTLTSTVSQTLAATGAVARSGRIMTAAASGGADHIVQVAPVTARTVFPVSAPIVASRLRCTAFTTAGYAFLVAVQGGHPS